MKKSFGIKFILRLSHFFLTINIIAIFGFIIAVMMLSELQVRNRGTKRRHPSLLQMMIP